MEPTPQVINSTTPPPASNWKQRVPFFFIAGLVIVILAEVVWGFKLLSSAPLSSAAVAPPLIDTVVPQLIVLPAKEQIQIGETVPVVIKAVTAGNPTDGVDVIIKYDPAVLEPLKTNFFELGAIFPEFPVAEVDPKQGIIQISGTTPVNNSGFSGIGILATLNFKAKAEGTSAITIDFQKDSTADSNLVLSGSNHDLLQQVINSSVTVSKNLPSVVESQITSCSGFFQYCSIGEKIGKQFCQSGILKNNICTFDPVATVSCTECQLQ